MWEQLKDNDKVSCTILPDGGNGNGNAMVVDEEIVRLCSSWSEDELVENNPRRQSRFETRMTIKVLSSIKV